MSIPGNINICFPVAGLKKTPRCQLFLWAGITFSLGKDTEWMARLQEFPATVCSRSNGKHERWLRDCSNSERACQMKWWGVKSIILTVKVFLLSLMFSHVHWSFLKKGCLLISSTPLRPSRTSLWGSGRTYLVWFLIISTVMCDFHTSISTFLIFLCKEAHFPCYYVHVNQDSFHRGSS